MHVKIHDYAHPTTSKPLASTLQLYINATPSAKGSYISAYILSQLTLTSCIFLTYRLKGATFRPFKKVDYELTVSEYAWNVLFSTEST